jgi:hypothetical protein
MPAPHEDVDQVKIKQDSKQDAKTQGEQQPTRRERNFLTVDTENPLIVRGID